MNCAEAGDVLAEYLYHDLAPTERAALEQHVENCADCAGQLERMQATTDWLDRAQTPLPQPLSPVPLLVRQAGELRRYARRWRRGAVAAAALAAGVLLAIAAIDHVRWENNKLIVHFGPEAPRPQVAAVDENLKERLRRAETFINVLDESVERLDASVGQLVVQQRQFIADLQQTMQGTTQYAGGAGPSNDFLAEVLDDF